MQPAFAVPLQLAPAIEVPCSVIAIAAMSHWPTAAAPQAARPSAELAPSRSVAVASAAKEQVEPSEQFAPAPACATPGLVPTLPLVMQTPLVPAVQSARMFAAACMAPSVLRPVPSTWVRHPVPAHVPCTCPTPGATNDPVLAEQEPAPAHSEVATAWKAWSTAGAVPVRRSCSSVPGSSVTTVVLRMVTGHSALPVRQPPSAPAAVVPNGASPVPATTVPDVARPIWQAAFPVQAAAPRATDTAVGSLAVPLLLAGPGAAPAAIARARSAVAPAPPSRLAAETVSTVALPVQPAGQSSWALACVEPDMPGSFRPGLAGSSAPVSVVVKLAAPAAMVQAAPPHVLSEWERLTAVSPGTVTFASPVTAARHAGPEQTAAALELLIVAGAPVTGSAACAAASVAAFFASSAAFAASAAFVMSSVVAPLRAATCFACSATLPASRACWASCSAVFLFCSATMSATT